MSLQSEKSLIIPNQEFDILVLLYNQYINSQNNPEPFGIILKGKMYEIIFTYLERNFSENSEKINIYSFTNTNTNEIKFISAHSTQELLYKIYMNNIYNIIDNFINSELGNILSKKSELNDLYHILYTGVFDNSEYLVDKCIVL